MCDVDDPRSSAPFPIVGVGASAGGLEAFTQLLQGLPPDTGLGFVLIQHLDRTHPSMLPEVLARATAMPVQQAEHGMLVEPNHVYVIAPNTDLAIRDGRLVVSPRPTEGGRGATPEAKLTQSPEELISGNAERANRAKDDFLATLSHELRTPLSSMLLNAQRLRNGQVVEPAELQRAGEALEHATWMQVSLIDNLLDASYIVAGKLTLDPRPIDLCDIIRASLDDVKLLAEAKALVLKVVLDPACDPILADRTRVHQVVSNLLTNAIKFTPRGGQVTIVADAASGFARLRVTDTGIGIEAEFLPHVFARFSQKDGSITREYGGLGLGLALVRHLVELQGGTVRAESQGAGQGATFSVTFPQASADADAALAAPPQPAHALDRPGRTQRYDSLVGLRVLFVDNDLSTRDAVREVLQLTGVRVELAASAAEGMAAVATFKPQVILCDIMMPGEDGYMFVRKLRARDAEHGGTIPALAFSALASEDDRRRALAAGFQLLLAKPVDIDRLRKAVLELSNLVQAPIVPAQPAPVR